MTEDNELYEPDMQALHSLIISDSDESKEEPGSSSCEEEEENNAIPPSLLSYFETSKSRAAVCEKLILEDLEDSDSTAFHHGDGLIELTAELNKEERTVDELITLEMKSEEDTTDDEEIKSVYEAERQQHSSEDVQKEEQRRQRELDFQQELWKIMEEEKLHQVNLELIKREAQEKLEQELLLQKDFIRKLQKRLERDRGMIEVERKRKKEEERNRMEKEDCRKRETEEKRKRQDDRKRTEEEKKIKYIDIGLKDKDQTTLKEKEKRKNEADEKRKSEKEKNKREEGMRKEEEADEKRKSEKEKYKKEEKHRKEEEEEKRKDKKEKDKKEEEIKKNEEGDEKRNSEKEKDTREEEMRKEEVGDENRKSQKEKDKREEEMKKEEKRDERRKSEKEKDKREEEMEKKEEEIKMECKQLREKEERHEEKRMKIERTSAIKKRRNEEIIKSKNELGMMEEMEGEEPITNRSTWVRTKEEEVEKNEEGQEQKPDEEREERETGQLDRRKLDKDLIKIQDGSENVWTSEENNNEDKVKQNTVEDPHVRRGADEQEHTHAQEEGITLRQETEDHGGNARDLENKEEAGIRHKMEETKEDQDGDTKSKEETGGREGNKDSEDEHMFISQKENIDKKSLNSQNEQKGRDPLSPLGPGLSPSEASVRQACSESTQDPLSHRNISLPVSLPEHTEQKRLSWIRDCIGWSQLSLHNTRRQNGSVLSGRRRRRACGASRPPPLCPHTLLRLSGCTALQEVTTVTLEDLPCCGLSTLAQCPQLRSLSLRRCGLKSLEGVGQLRELCYIDLQENEISLVDCEHMTGLRVLRLARNKLTTIHGLSGADNLNILDLSHNSITRIADLESVTRLQRLSVAHNQLISTKGLRDVYTLLHLDLSHNHLTRVEGLENNALLHTLDLRSNSLSEPPGLNNQVLLREVRLDDNSISSVEGLAACWLPLMQTLSVSQNRITQLPSMTDFVSLENMDLRFNCLSELQNVCESLMGCHFLREVHLLGNPLQQDRGWRPTLQKALPGLRAIDSQQTDSLPSALPGQQLNAVPGCFFTLCQAQLQQTQDLQQRHSEELSRASSPLDAVKSFSRHFAEAQKLAEDQRFAHEYGDTTVSENTAAVQTIAEKASNVDLQTGCIYWPEMDTANKGTAVVQRKNNIRSNSGSFEEKPAEEINGERTSLNLDKVILSGFHDLGHKKSAAAVSIQRRWRKYRQKCGNVDASIIESEWKTKGDGEEPESGSPFSNRSAAGRDHAATVIQAFWRGFALRRRLACALAAVTWPDAGEEDAFEEVDVEEFVFDEPELEKYWTVTFSEDWPPRHCPKSQQPSSSKPPVSVDDPSQYFRSPPFVQSPRQAWMAEQQVDSVAQRISLESSNRSQSPASSSGLSGLSERSEKILEEWGFTDSRTAQLMLKRAQRMKLTKKQQKKNCNPSLRLAVIENCTYERGPVEARNRPAQCNRYSLKVGEAGLGLQQAERPERMRREKAPHGQHTRTAQPDSVHFLPEMNSSILQGGKVQLVAGGPDRPHATGLWPNSRLADQPGKANMYSGRNSLGHEKKEVSSPKRAASAPSKKERISFRDNPVQLSGGWGGGKKRDRLHK